MNTVAHNVVAKLSVAFVAVAMLFMMVSPAKAATAEEMQQMINQLLAQVAQLQGNLGGASASAGMCPYTWTRALSTGATGMDVMKLQQFLNSDSATMVAASGVGSKGMETEYYGPATAAAVSKFQVKHGLVAVGTGSVGPLTMAKLNALCVAAPSTGGNTSDDSSDDSDNNTSGDLSGEASLKDITMEDGDDTTLEEGQSEASVADYSVEFEDGDAMVTRLDVTFDPSTSDDLWDILGDVTLSVDGEVVATVDGSDEDNYQKDDMTLRFAGLDIVSMEDDETVISIGVELQKNIDTVPANVDIDVTGMRWVDGDDVTTTEDSDSIDFYTSDVVNFDIDSEGADDELAVKTSTEDPDGTTLTVKDDKKSDWFTVFAFDLDTKESTNDIDLNHVFVSVVTDGATANIAGYADLVDDAELVIDGVTIDDVSIDAGDDTTEGTVVLDFNVDGDVTIDAGDRIGAELKLRFKALAVGNEGTTIQAKITGTDADDIDAEGADNLDATQLSGAATGDVHTLRTMGIDVDAGDMNASVTTVDGGSDYATYEIEVDVTAFEQDAYFSVDSATSTEWSLVDSSGAAVIAGTSRTPVLDSTADEENGYFIVREGETETFTLTVTYKPGAATSARLQLDGLNFSEDEDTTPPQSWTASPATDYRTTVKTITD